MLLLEYYTNEINKKLLNKKNGLKPFLNQVFVLNVNLSKIVCSQTIVFHLPRRNGTKHL